MTLPEGWEWMDEIPSGWVPPEELRVPTGILSTDLPIMMLSSSALGNDLIDLVGRLLSESARFSIWFGSEAKKTASPKELALLSLITNEQHRHVYEAWTLFIDAYNASGRKAGSFDSELDALRHVLLDSIRNIAAARRDFEGGK
ncbi:hypothetical protein ACGFZR_05400 [Streptomyces sp. NPDC048241]|uniref:hypothetical protein n=1 Tax=Streptomyces sp. NPDC048241 TaxID=3365521 RepID=UPI00371C780A